MSRTRRHSCGVPGVLVGDVGEEAVDRHQPAVAGGGAVLPVGLEVGQERQHGVGAEIGELEPDHLPAAVPCREPEEEFARVPVGVDGVLADVALRREVVLEEAAEQARNGGLRAHELVTGRGEQTFGEGVEAGVRLLQERGGDAQVDLGVADAGVAKVGAQQRQPGHDVFAVAIPEQQPGDRESRPQVVQPGTAAVGFA